MEKLNTTLRMLRSRLFDFFALCMVMGLSLAVAPNMAQAQTTPPAGTNIQNQASATYTDNNNNPQTVSSNTVTTVVQQVASLTLTQGTTKSSNPGGQVVFPHTITNTGNGADSFTLSYTDNGGDFSFTSIQYFADSDGNGIADNATPITTTPSVPGASNPNNTYSFVAVAQVPTSPTAQDGDSATLDVTATSVFNTGVSASTSSTTSDQANVTEDASVDVLKSLSSYSGTPGATVTVTLTFTNNGNADASNLVVKDLLPAGFTYVAGSGKWSGSGTDLTDTDGASDDPSGISYDYDNTTAGQVTATIASLTSGQQGTLTFDVTVDAGTQGQTIPNTAKYRHDDFGTDPDQSTNTTQYVVNQTYQVDYNDDDGTDDGIRIKGPVTQGATVKFVNKFTNNGTTSDRFDITLGTDNYPAGTTFTLYKGDGSGNTAGLLTNSVGSSAPDIGPVAVGATVEVILQVQLPAGANGTGPFNIQKTATSVGDPTKSATLTDRLSSGGGGGPAITPNQVDVTNNGAYVASPGTPADGQGIYATGETSAVTSNATNPGTTTNFTLYINNLSAQSDNYNLAASSLGDFSTGLPSGYNVQFRSGSPSGSVITNTGTIAAGGNLKVIAIVTVPSNALAGAQDIYFRAQSTTSGAEDVKHDAVTVNSIRSISLVTNQNGQIAPGGSVVYSHTLTNTGNTTENDGTTSALQLQLANSASSGFQAVVYIDNGTTAGSIDANDTQVTTAAAGSAVSIQSSLGSLAPGASVTLLLKVTGNAGVTDGTTNTTTLTASDDGTASGALTSVSLGDITTVVLGNLVINKKQRIQNLSTPNSYVSTQLQANPGDIIEYQLIVTNQGSAAVTSINLTDSTPSFTKLSTAATVTSGSATVDSQPSVGGTGTITVSLGSLGAGQSFTVTFAVQVDGTP